jgi:two-component system sensor histidine kinase HydH
MRRLRSRSIQRFTLVAVGTAALLTVAIGVHGWVRSLALCLIATLIAVAQRGQSAARRSFVRACHEAVSANAQRLQELSSLQSALAHKLNNPLATIKALAGLMGLEPARAALRLPTLQLEVGRMQKIIEELLDLSRPMTPLVVERIELRALVRAVAELHEELARAKNIELVAAPGPPIAVCGDPRKLKQVLMGLLQNAIEASPEGQMIGLTLAVDEARVHVAVLDRGPGIPVADLERVVRAGVTTKPSSPGLGLTVALALVEQHCGSLTLENRQDGGFAARFQLPLDCSERDSVDGVRACA